METKKSSPRNLSGFSKPEIIKEKVNVKAAHPSSNPMNGLHFQNHSHFEFEVFNAFFRVFNF